MDETKEQELAKAGKRMADLIVDITAVRAELTIARRAQNDASSAANSLDTRVRNLENEYEKLAALFIPSRAASVRVGE